MIPCTIAWLAALFTSPAAQGVVDDGRAGVELRFELAEPEYALRLFGEQPTGAGGALSRPGQAGYEADLAERIRGLLEPCFPFLDFEAEHPVHRLRVVVGDGTEKGPEVNVCEVRFFLHLADLDPDTGDPRHPVTHDDWILREGYLFRDDLGGTAGFADEVVAALAERLNADLSSLCRQLLWRVDLETEVLFVPGEPPYCHLSVTREELGGGSHSVYALRRKADNGGALYHGLMQHYPDPSAECPFQVEPDPGIWVREYSGLDEELTAEHRPLGEPLTECGSLEVDALHVIDLDLRPALRPARNTPARYMEER